MICVICEEEGRKSNFNNSKTICDRCFKEISIHKILDNESLTSQNQKPCTLKEGEGEEKGAAIVQGFSSLTSQKPTLNEPKQESTNIDKEEEKGEIPFNGTFESLTSQKPTLNEPKRNRQSDITTKSDGRFQFKGIKSKKNETKEQFKTRLITELGYKETDFKKDIDVEEIKVVAKNEQAAGNQEPNDIEVSPTKTLAIPDTSEAEEDPFIAMVKRDGFGPTYPPRNFKENEK